MSDQRVFGWDSRDIALVSLMLAFVGWCFGALLVLFCLGLFGITGDIGNLFVVVVPIFLVLCYILMSFIPRLKNSVVVTNSSITITFPFFPVSKKIIPWEDVAGYEAVGNSRGVGTYALYSQKSIYGSSQNYRLTTRDGQKIILYRFIKDLPVLLEVIKNKGTNLFLIVGAPEIKKIPVWQYLVFGLVMPAVIILGIIVYSCKVAGCPEMPQILQSLTK